MGKRLKWNRELRKTAVCFCAVFVLGMVILQLGLRICGSRMREENKAFLAAVFGNVLLAYPDVSEEELIQVLSSEGNESMGEERLARYGMFEEHWAGTFSLQERQISAVQIFSAALFILLFALTALFFLRRTEKLQGRIAELEAYMEALHRDEYSLVPEDNDDDELSGLRNEIYKLTVLLKEQARRAADQRRALADSVADISHQLKTPLTSITVLMDNLTENEDMEPEVRRHFMSEIAYQLGGMSWLTATMLKLSRLDAGVVELERKNCAVDRLVAEALQRVEVTAEWNQVSFGLEIPPETVVEADYRWTVEALSNILKNAVEHSPREEKVEILAEENEIYTRITVRDHGAGISEEEREMLFRRFYRGPSAGEDSVGIGLALAKRIVEEQKGHISVDSEKGRGTCFKVTFLKGVGDGGTDLLHKHMENPGFQ